MLCRAYRLVSINIQEVPGGQAFIGLKSALCNYREWAPNPETGWRWGLRNASPEEVRSEQAVNDAEELHREAEKEGHPRKGEQCLRAQKSDHVLHLDSGTLDLLVFNLLNGCSFLVFSSVFLAYPFIVERPQAFGAEASSLLSVHYFSLISSNPISWH